MDDVGKLKKEVRTGIKRAIAALTPEQRAARSAAACGRALVSDLFPSDGSILLYAPMADKELDIRLLAEGLWARGCRVSLPRVEWGACRLDAVEVRNLTTDLELEVGGPGNGMFTPRRECPVLSSDAIDVVVVPGLGFDRAGNRLGRGGGFYDRFLSGMSGAPGKPVRIAVIFDEQLVEYVPTEPHDQRVDWIVTPTELIRAA